MEKGGGEGISDCCTAILPRVPQGRKIVFKEGRVDILLPKHLSIQYRVIPGDFCCNLNVPYMVHVDIRIIQTCIYTLVKASV